MTKELGNTWRERIAFYFDDTDSFAGKVVDLVLLGVNLLACALFVIGSYPQFMDNGALRIANWIVVGVFIIEYLLRLWVAERRLKYVFSIYGIIDLISILPSIFTQHQFVFLKVLKVLRILRFLRFLERGDFFFGKISSLRLQVLRTLFTVFAILFVSSGMILSVESGAPDAQIKTFDQAFYYCVITLSTVGYGDFVTVTAWGRFWTVIMILGGAFLLPWQVGKLVKELISMEDRKKEIVCKQCGLKKHDLDASHCKACGSVIFQEYDGA